MFICTKCSCFINLFSRSILEHHFDLYLSAAKIRTECLWFPVVLRKIKQLFPSEEEMFLIYFMDILKFGQSQSNKGKCSILQMFIFFIWIHKLYYMFTDLVRLNIYFHKKLQKINTIVDIKNRNLSNTYMIHNYSKMGSFQRISLLKAMGSLVHVYWRISLANIYKN